MGKLKFITKDGVCGHTEEWEDENAVWDAWGWIHEHGARIGSGTAPLPNGGWIDLGQFAVIQDASSE